MNDIKEFELLLKKKGYNLLPIGVNGIALRKNHSLRAVEILENNKIPILGGDVFVLSNEKIEFSYDSWYCNEEDFNQYEEYLHNSWEVSRKYIELFKDTVREIYLFQIIL
jgi:hypothetical protein